jgi:Na+/H+ antiporter NhaD/arsenite permease-like protein
VIFLASYLVFALGRFPGTRIDRTAAAIIGAALMFAFHVITPASGIQSIDYVTLVLLFSMMLIAASLHACGFFEWVAATFVEHVPVRHLLPGVIFTSGILSAFLVNDIVCLLMAPLVLQICREFSRKPTPYLLALAMASNIGSAAAITGNPQNILIGSVAGLSYISFLVHLGPVAIAGLFLAWAVLHFLYFRGKKQNDAEARARNNAGSIRVSTSRLFFPVTVTLMVLVGFFAGAPPALVAAMGAAILLMYPKFHPREIYSEIDWPLLVFFTGLFLIVGGVTESGIAGRLLTLAEKLNLQNHWIFSGVTVLLSNTVSNVPAVMLLKGLAPQYGNGHFFWMLLSLASTLAGNLTITGSVANIIVVEKARPESPISFTEYLRAGVPITLLTTVTGVLWLKMIG